MVMLTRAAAWGKSLAKDLGSRPVGQARRGAMLRRLEGGGGRGGGSPRFKGIADADRGTPQAGRGTRRLLGGAKRRTELELKPSACSVQQAPSSSTSGSIRGSPNPSR